MDEPTGSSRLAGVDVADNDDVDMNLLFTNKKRIVSSSPVFDSIFREREDCRFFVRLGDAYPIVKMRWRSSYQV